MVDQTQDEAINIYDNLWSSSTLHDDKKVYITFLQFSYLINLHFPYDMIYPPNGCEANGITFVLPFNNKLNVEPINESPKYKLGFNRSYSKIDNFSQMQSIIYQTSQTAD